MIIGVQNGSVGHLWKCVLQVLQFRLKWPVNFKFVNINAGKPLTWKLPNIFKI